ncbi:hypothetical protein IV203_004553 [Nitzschia inconspicua]|uniref:GAG-pre-integrase domain-containing protein n=1 Tax=Nitzschia inconspicua TaxID=303405 RepID=A0A9K3PPT2_9STRA|nr:hypothetical protein IV203_004553 [Nitzschia inconspicua]
MNWWADCCESDQSDDTNDDLPDLISRNVDSDKEDDEDDEDDLTELLNDKVYDDDNLVLIIPNDDDSTSEPIVIGCEISYTDEDMNKWCTVHEVEELEEDKVCLTVGTKNKVDDNLMIGDTGATVHMRLNTSGMYDLRKEKCVIKYGNRAHSTSTVVGKWAGMIKDNGVLKKVILDGVTVVPGSAYNLLSLTRALNKGIIKSNGETMILECNRTTIRFDHRIETANGFLLAARFEPMELQSESAHVSLKEGTKVQISKFHTMMGHANEDSIRLTAKHMGVILTGKMNKCEPCAIGKLKQTPVPKVTSREVTKLEAANCATDLECLLVKKTGDITPYELIYGKVAPYGPYLRTFGEIGVARDITTVKGKLDDRGSPAIFLGYAKQHTGNVYRMLDIKTQHLRLSRDVQ